MYTWDSHGNSNGPDFFSIELENELIYNVTFSNISSEYGWSYDLNQSFPDQFLSTDDIGFVGTGNSEYFEIPNQGSWYNKIRNFIELTTY